MDIHNIHICIDSYMVMWLTLRSSSHTLLWGVLVTWYIYGLYYYVLLTICIHIIHTYLYIYTYVHKYMHVLIHGYTQYTYMHRFVHWYIMIYSKGWDEMIVCVCVFADAFLQVPAFQPVRGLDMFSRFLKGTFWLCSRNEQFLPSALHCDFQMYQN